MPNEKDKKKVCKLNSSHPIALPRLAAIAVILARLDNITNSIPYFGVAVGLLKEIVAIAEEASRNEEEAGVIAERICKFMSLMMRYKNKHLSEEMEQNMEKFYENLQEIKGSLTKITAPRSKFNWFLTSYKDADVIKEINQKITEAYKLFELESHLSLHSELTDLKEVIENYAEKHSSRPTSEFAANTRPTSRSKDSYISSQLRKESPTNSQHRDIPSKSAHHAALPRKSSCQTPEPPSHPPQVSSLPLSLPGSAPQQPSPSTTSSIPNPSRRSFYSQMTSTTQTPGESMPKNGTSSDQMSRRVTSSEISTKSIKDISTTIVTKTVKETKIRRVLSPPVAL